MTQAIYLPPDEFHNAKAADLDLAADFLELNALFSSDGQSLSEDIVGALEFTAEEDFTDVDAEIKTREEVATRAIARMSLRKRILEESYPFDIDEYGDVISFTGEEPDLGKTAYIVSLILSNLKSVSPLLADNDLHPSREDVDCLRRYFQYFATAAIAAEVGGPAWSFGFPRPDGSGFLTKLCEIWESLRDGSVDPDPSAPSYPKDDQIDIIAWREQRDCLPGFLLVAAQVATGRDWKEKSIRAHVAGVFASRWFNPIPVTTMVAYHVIPFSRPKEEFRDDVLVLGNVLHRLRVPYRVREASSLVRNGIAIEAFELLDDASKWIHFYVKRARAS